MKVYCPYCGKEAELIDSSVIYGRSYGMAYICFGCDAYVGTQHVYLLPLLRRENGYGRFRRLGEITCTANAEQN